jgi:hypothetical protein
MLRWLIAAIIIVGGAVFVAAAGKDMKRYLDMRRM